MDLSRVRTNNLGWVKVAKSLAPPIAWQWLYRRLVVGRITLADQYRPHYQPWQSPEFRSKYDAVRRFTEVSIDRCWTLVNAVEQTGHLEGAVIEAGVFRGGTARLIASALAQQTPVRTLYLFDSFEGMREVSDDKDRHRRGDFADTSLQAVSALLAEFPQIVFRKGWIPETFAGLEQLRFSFAHVDLDLHDGIIDTLNFLYPRLVPGGVIVFDDYALASCPGAREAVDSFFADKPEAPLAMLTGQGLVHKL